MNTRFDAVDRRFEDNLNAMNTRFEAVDRRFEDNLNAMNTRFEAVDRRFDDVNKRFAAVQWMMGIGFIMIGTLVSIFGIFG